MPLKVKTWMRIGIVHCCALLPNGTLLYRFHYFSENGSVGGESVKVYEVSICFMKTFLSKTVNSWVS